MSSKADLRFLRLALGLARRGYGRTSPNPMVGAVLVRGGRVLGQGWHRQAGSPHAEIEALHHARSRNRSVTGATLYVTLEPCSTHGRTPPCTQALIQARLARVVVGAIDPNPAHAGRGLKLLRKSGLQVAVASGPIADEIADLNAAFNHWIVHKQPWVTLKVAMTLDGKIATASGQSRWITGPRARHLAMHWRQGADAILVGLGTVLADNPSLTVRLGTPPVPHARGPRRIVLDSHARTPLDAALVTDAWTSRTVIVVTRHAPRTRVAALQKRVSVWIAPARQGRVSLRWLLNRLGRESVTSLLVEGGGQVHASFLFGGFAHRVAFFYAPKILGGIHARKAVAGPGVTSLNNAIRLRQVHWQTVGDDLLMTARVAGASDS